MARAHSGARGRAARRRSRQVGVRVQRARAVRTEAGGGRRDGRRERAAGALGGTTAWCGSTADGPLAWDGTSTGVTRNGWIG